ncbi:MAG TPA: MbtH domain protein [Candidatus Angelobacter sp.]|jgi:hypothetical protein
MSDLVTRLSLGEHPVEITMRSVITLNGLRDRIARGFLHVKFTGTRGGTELGIRLDKTACKLDADFDRGTGRIHVVGTLTLDYEKVKCFADIDLATFAGTGHLSPA